MKLSRIYFYYLTFGFFVFFENALFGVANWQEVTSPFSTADLQARHGT